MSPWMMPQLVEQIHTANDKGGVAASRLFLLASFALPRRAPLWASESGNNLFTAT